MKVKYSVIIPVYKAEKTIRRCLDSLVGQCLDAEIVLVNDGSPDDCDSICSDYAKRYSFIKYICQKNQGVSAARNAGIANASGKYILFVDSDDYVVDNYFSIIDAELAHNDWDWIRFSSCVDNGQNITQNINNRIECIKRDDSVSYIADDISRKRINSPWAKLYKKEIIDKYQIAFPMGVSVAEDRAFNIVYSIHINNYLISEIPVYYVNIDNSDSLTRGKQSNLKNQFRIAEEYIIDSLNGVESNKEKDLYQRALNFCTCRSIYHDSKDLHKNKIGWWTRQKKLYRMCRTMNKKHLKYPKNKYCFLITLPVRLCIPIVIDMITKRLVKV